MENVTSKRSINFYINTILGFLIFTATSAFFGSMFIYRLNNDQTKSFEIYLLPLLSIASFTFAIFLIYFYIKYVPPILITHKTIKVRNKTYSLSDIQFIIYTGKQPFIYNDKEGAKISLNDGNITYIYDGLYANAPALKAFLDSVLNNRVIINVPVSIYKISGENIKYFTQSVFTNSKLFAINCTGFVLTILLIINTDVSLTILFLPIFIFLIACPLLSREMYYFGINEKYFVVRNHVLFWIKEVYPISFIREVVYEPRYKRRKGLRIITKNYCSKFHIAETLGNDSWQELQRALEAQNIKVRNEFNL